MYIYIYIYIYNTGRTWPSVQSESRSEHSIFEKLTRTYLRPGRRYKLQQRKRSTEQASEAMLPSETEHARATISRAQVRPSGIERPRRFPRAP